MAPLWGLGPLENSRTDMILPKMWVMTVDGGAKTYENRQFESFRSLACGFLGATSPSTMLVVKQSSSSRASGAAMEALRGRRKKRFGWNAGIRFMKENVKFQIGCFCKVSFRR
jgi:hypothetical protein